LKVLVADDDRLARRLLETVLTGWGYEVVVAGDGDAAWSVLSGDNEPPPIAVLDWVMPGMTGVEVCQKVRARASLSHLYIVVLTTRSGTEDLVAALEAGADDHLTKPFLPAELKARMRVGERVARLQQSLKDRVTALERALADVTQLQGLLPICMYCKKIRTDNNYWQQVDSYIGEHSGATFTHGICPECRETRVKAEIERARRSLGRPEGDSDR
jgi:sigma-B regulation protein RsbU (phosphoserine phosphatase)